MLVVDTAELVHSFYDDLWNRWNDALVPVVLSPTFEFRGSLGTVSIGRDGWLDYRHVVRSGSADFHNRILTLVTDGDRAYRQSGTSSCSMPRDKRLYMGCTATIGCQPFFSASQSMRQTCQEA